MTEALSFSNDWRNVNHRCLSVTGALGMWRAEGVKKGSRGKGLLTWQSASSPGQVCQHLKASGEEAWA